VFYTGIVTISGTPTIGYYGNNCLYYTITTTGSPCSGDTTGTITLDPDDDLDLISAQEPMHKYFVRETL